MDAFTFEIIRHRLFRAVEEAIITLKQVSGSAATNEGHDIMVSIYRADGTLAMGGVGFLHHLVPAAEACQHIIRRFDGRIFEGDVYMVNDPYVAALHTSDVFLVTPIHYRGRLVNWSACFVHVYDIGAMQAGGFCPDARSVLSEGFSTPGIKLVERGEVRQDVMDTILNMVRVPEMVALDLSAMIACGNVARDRMVALLDKYGVDAVDEVTQTLIDQSERLMRDRLRELPNGRWQSRQYMHIKDQVFRVSLSMTKSDDTLTFDFTGSSPQSEDYGINCSYWAVLGGLTAPYFPLLAHDITWNDGLLRPIRMIAPEESVVHAKRPAPTSCATVCAIQSVNNVSSTALSKMLLASEKYAKEATSVWHGNLVALFINGKNQKGHDTIGLMTETLAGSGGARTFADGVDFGGELPNPICRMANVEMTEAMFAVRYLFRRRMQDSAGAGQYRGGTGGEYALMAHDTPDDGMNYVVACKGLDFPVAEGLGGGYTGAPNYCAWVHNNDALANEQSEGDRSTKTHSDCRFAQSLQEMPGRKEAVHWGEYPLKGDDVLYVRWSGGGGFGDPLNREPQAVLADFRAGITSLEVARNVFGAVFDEANESVDGAATIEQRQELRSSFLMSKAGQ